MKDKVLSALITQYKTYIDKNIDEHDVIKAEPTIVRLNLRQLMDDLDLDESSFTLNSPLIFALQDLEFDGFIINGSQGVFGIYIDAHGKESRTIESRKIIVTDKFIKRLKTLP